MINATLFRAHPLLISQSGDDTAHLVYPGTKENSDNNKSSNIISGLVILPALAELSHSPLS